MAVTFVQKAAATFGDSVVSQSFTLTGTTNNNLLVLETTQLSGDTISPANTINTPSGWTAAVHNAGPTGTDSFKPSCGIFWQVSGGGDVTATINYPDGCYVEGTISEYSGGAAGSWGGVTTAHNELSAGTDTSGNSGTAAAPSGGANVVVAVACPQDPSFTNVNSLSDPPSSGFTSITSNPNNSAHVCCDSGYKLNASGTQSASWTWTNGARLAAAIATFTFTPSASPAQPFVPTPQPVEQPPFNMAALAQAAQTVQLVAQAGVYVPIGDDMIRPQELAAYREDPRLPQITVPQPVTQLVAQAGVYVPVDSTRALLQTQVAYREASRLPQALVGPFSPGITPGATFSPPIQPTVEPPWPYWNTILLPGPASLGITPGATFSPPIQPTVEPPWPYWNTILLPGPYSAGVTPGFTFSPPVHPFAYREPARAPQPPPVFSPPPAAPVQTFSPALQPTVEPPWPYTQVVLMPGPYSAGITPPYVFSPPVHPFAYREPERLPQQMSVFAAPPPAAQTFSPPIQPTIEPPWPYWSTILLPGPASIGITPAYAYSPALQPTVEPPWPYWNTILQPGPASLGITPVYAYSPALQPTVEPPWPYWNTILQPGPASIGVTPPYALSPPLNPVRQPPWPSASATIPLISTAVIPVPATILLSPPIQPVRQPEWPYASARLMPPNVPALPIAPPLSPALQPTVEPPWPYTQEILLPPPRFAGLAPSGPFFAPPPVLQFYNGWDARSWPYSVAPSVAGVVPVQYDGVPFTSALGALFAAIQAGKGYIYRNIPLATNQLPTIFYQTGTFVVPPGATNVFCSGTAAGGSPLGLAGQQSLHFPLPAKSGDTISILIPTSGDVQVSVNGVQVLYLFAGKPNAKDEWNGAGFFQDSLIAGFGSGVDSGVPFPPIMVIYWN